jgi:hypothetical protein
MAINGSVPNENSKVFSHDVVCPITDRATIFHDANYRRREIIGKCISAHAASAREMRENYRVETMT